MKELRKSIVESGMSQNQLSILSGVNRAQINRFVNEERTLTLESAERIAKVLKLELKKQKGKLISFGFERKTTKVVIGKKKKAR